VVKVILTTGRIADTQHTQTVKWYLPGGASVHPHLTNAYLGSPKSKSHMASRSVQPFLHSSWHTVVGMSGHALLPLKLLLPMMMGPGPPSNTWFLEFIWAYNPNGMLIGSAIFTGLTVIIDTDRPRYSICSNKLHLASAAMRPKSNTCNSDNHVYKNNNSHGYHRRCC